jgi:phosphoserine phosphatase
MPGTKETLTLLHKNGFITAIISSGISLLAEKLQKNLGIKYVFANQLLTDANGILTGEGNPVVPLWEKGRVLNHLLNKLKINPNNCAVVGDSIFDIPLFDIAGLSVAFNSKDKRIRKISDVFVESNNLKDILPYFINVDSQKPIKKN